MKTFKIGEVAVEPGERRRIELSVAALYDLTQMKISVEVIRGKQDGPILFLSAAIHGDEINGTEIINRVLERKKLLSGIKGTLIAAPIVNVFGYNRNIRYLPDRRDLNRSFPGGSSGSLAAQVANIFMKEIVSKATHGIDLHTGAIHRYNLAQVRACLDDPETKRLASIFSAPVTLNSILRDGSLRQAAADKGIPMLLFEGGEALRFDERIINTALKGIISVMSAIGMIEKDKVSKTRTPKKSFVARSSSWVRAVESGSLRIKKRIGSRVKIGELLAIISGPFASKKTEIRSPLDGIIVGISQLPLVNKGDAVFHIATFNDSAAVEERVDFYNEEPLNTDLI